MAVTIEGYSHVTVMVTDIERARHFYGEVMGFEELPRPDFGGFGGMWYRVGNLQLHIGHVDEMAEKKGLPHIALHVPTGELHDTVETLRARGAHVMLEPRSREDFGKTVWAAFVTDPDGNGIELTDIGPLG